MIERQNIFQELYPEYKITNHIRLIELFGGIGFQSKALDNIQVNFERYRYIEFDPYCVKTYNAIHNTNFGTTDIRDVHAADLGIVERERKTYIMFYSFPCTDLSNAGHKQGMSKGSGTRSGLLWEVERILNECKDIDALPQVLIMENVPMIHSKNMMPDFTQWINALEGLGYSNYWQDMNSKDYGIPQNRNRTFMISILGNYNFTFPKKQELKTRLIDFLEDQVDEKYYLNEKQLEHLKITKYQSGKYESLVAKENAETCNTLRARDFKGAKCVEVGTIKPGGFRSTYSVYDKHGISPTLLTCTGGNRQVKILEEDEET